jgi:hypothetical protein
LSIKYPQSRNIATAFSAAKQEDKQKSERAEGLGSIAFG